ncbi:MAG: hypothetical protein ACR2OO_16115 [Thermomicrobiales bacterium]
MVESSPRGTVPRSGDLATDIELTGNDGATVKLSQLWSASRNGLILVFLRQFG